MRGLFEILDQAVKHLILVGIVGITLAYAGLAEQLKDALFVSLVGLALFGWLGWFRENRRRYYSTRFKNEAAALPSIREWLTKLPDGSVVLVAGVTTSSVFSLFKEIIDILSRGCEVRVLLMDPRETEILKMLAGSERERFLSLLKKLREDTELLKVVPPDNQNDVNHILDDAIKAKQEMRYVTAIKACTYLWLQGKRKFYQTKDIIPRLEIKAYHQLPQLKVWTSTNMPECFRGEYLTAPGLGVENAIYLHKRDKNDQKEIVDEIRKRLKLLWDERRNRGCQIQFHCEEKA